MFDHDHHVFLRLKVSSFQMLNIITRKVELPETFALFPMQSCACVTLPPAPVSQVECLVCPPPPPPFKINNYDVSAFCTIGSDRPEKSKRNAPVQQYTSTPHVRLRLHMCNETAATTLLEVVPGSCMWVSSESDPTWSWEDFFDQYFSDLKERLVESQLPSSTERHHSRLLDINACTEIYAKQSYQLFFQSPPALTAHFPYSAPLSLHV